jgi:hypothetical protein
MRALWIALWFAVLGWDALLPHIVAPAPRLATGALIAAALLFSAPRARRGPWFSPGVGASLVIGAAIAALVVPWPERLGFILVAAGGLVLLVPRLPDRVRGPLWRAPSALGAILVALSVTSHLYRIAESTWYRLGSMAGPIAALYRLLGLTAAADAPFVHVRDVGSTITFDASVGAVVGHALALYVVAGLAMLVILRGQRLGWRTLLVLLACAGGAALARVLVFGLALVENPGPSIFWLRGWTMGALLPLAGILMVVLRPAGSAREHAPAASSAGLPTVVSWADLRRGRGVRVLTAAVLLGALSAASIGFFDPGVRKDGRILVDEQHSNWAWSTVALNTETYGTQTVYNYSEMLRYLGHFYEIAPNFAALTDSLLETTDVMVLKTPTRPYASEELDALERFVERGGGLWLIGDHTNIFGMSSNLNLVAHRFGLRYRYDAVVDLTTGGRQVYERPRLFSHPSVAHLPPLLMATSCSLAGPPFGRRVMVGRTLLSDEQDYSVNTFFGNFSPDGHEPFGSMLQAMAVSRGRGRVLAFSDSTIFSNFFFFIRGKRELALGSVAWLMYENKPGWVRPVLLVGALLGLLVFMRLAWNRPGTYALAFLGAGTVPAFALVAFLLTAWVSGWSALPEPIRAIPEVGFMRERCAFHIPELTSLPDESPHSYHTFYIWTQKVGLVPRTDSLLSCLEDTKITIIINPRGEFTAEMLDGVENYVREGGGLLVLDRPYMMEPTGQAGHGPHEHGSTANEVLERFGLSFEGVVVDSAIVRDVATGDSLTMERVGTVLGGEPLLVLPDGRAVLAVAEFGKGRVVALPAADSFSDAVLGTTSQVPDENQLKLYRLQFRILDEILRPRSEERAAEPQQTG